MNQSISMKKMGTGTLVLGLVAVAAYGAGCGPATPEGVTPGGATTAAPTAEVTPAPTAAAVTTAALTAGTPTAAPAAAPFACAPGARCIKTDKNGFPNDAGGNIAQCSGTYPDYITTVSPGYAGKPFVMAQDYPKTPPKPEKAPWKGLKFHTREGADAYMAAVRKYIYDGMIPANWVPQDNKLVKWVHVPWMTAGSGPREFTHGLTQERRLKNGELGIKPGLTVNNYAVGFYNDVGAYSIGQMWADPGSPKPRSSHFAEGTVVAKVLFTSGTAGDWAVASPADWILDGAPSWDANVLATNGTTPSIRKVTILQMDIAVRDDDAKPTGWVFGTFAFNKDAPGAGWEKMAPVGVMWGNDPGASPPPGDCKTASSQIKESVISDKAPAYAKGHLGCQGRLNGPVDNPLSSCMSCHSTAQTPQSAPMLSPAGQCTPKQTVQWFRDLEGGQAFGDLKDNTCDVVADPEMVAFDYSLQNSIAYANFAAVKDDKDPKSAPLNNNPCIGTAQHAADPNTALEKKHELHRLPAER